MRQEAANIADILVARLAATQHGVASTAQLRTAGLSQDAVKRRVRAGRLHRVHRAVYAVGHTALGNEGRWMAAVLALGVEAVLSHRSAAELWGMLPARGGPVDVTVPTRAGRERRRGIRLHRVGSLPVTDTTRFKGIPVTTPARTLADLARVASRDEVRRAIREAEFLGLELSEQTSSEEELTRSELERRFLSLCRRHRITQPEVNASVGPFEVDFLWRGRRLIAETDGWRSHGGRAAFEQDRARDVELRLMGYDVVRFTYRQVTQHAIEVASALRTLLKP